MKLMSGHSKWSTIKHKKAALDSKRSGVFTKAANAITVAVRTGGSPDPEFNFGLRLAIEQAKSVNMPKDNIARAVDRGAGRGEGGALEEIVLEGYGPEGVAIVVVCVTDSHNRTVAEIKNLLEKNGGSLGEPGSVLFQFERASEVSFVGTLSESEMLALIDLGATEFDQEGEVAYVRSRPEVLHLLVEQLRTKEQVRGVLVYIAKAKIVAVNNKEGVYSLLEQLDEHDDVQEVYANI